MRNNRKKHRRPLLLLVPSLCLLIAGCESLKPQPAMRANGGGGSTGVVESAYDFFAAAGQEAPDYGLYSYVILPSPFTPKRNAQLLKALFETTISAENVGNPPSRVNVMYLPVRHVGEARRVTADRSLAAEKRIDKFLASIYQYPIAQALLSRFCGEHVEICRGRPSKGPYLLTYPKPASGADKLPSRYLFVDLSKVHRKAFGEFIDAFKAQVIRKDFTDRKRIDTLRLAVLGIVLTAADWLVPVREGIAGILHSNEGG